MAEDGCQFIEQWIGRCGEPVTDESPDRCEDHVFQTCASCGGKADTECNVTVLGLMCGRPICHDCTCPSHNGPTHTAGP